jgi:hypothetical protein
MIASTLSSVFAIYNAGQPILGTTGYPALSGNHFTGIMTVLYADGMPVVLGSNKVTLLLCASSCMTMNINLKQTAPGTYAYSFIPPQSLNGTITIAVMAGGLADDNGKIFPGVDTQIGTYATPGLGGYSASAPSDQVYPANPPAAQQSNSVPQAVAQPTPAQSTVHQSSMVGMVIAVVVVLLAAGGLLILPTRRVSK